MSYKSSIRIIFLCISFCVSCNKNQDKSKLPLVNINGIEIADLDPQKITDTTQIKLSQIADNIKVVVLQTTNESLLQSAFLMIGNKYILAQSGNEIYQFSVTGEFIRLLAKMGRGPEEIPSSGKNIMSNINEDLDLFFVTVADNIYLYKLSTGEFLGKKNLQSFGDLREARSITITTSDSLFIYSYYLRGGAPDDSLDCGIVVQDWQNNILWQKRFNYKTLTIIPSPVNYELLQGSNISVVSTDDPRVFIFQVDNHDTCYIFSIDDFSLEPYLLRRTQGPLKNGYPIDYFSVGSYRISYEFNRINGFHFMKMDFITELIDLNNPINGHIYHLIYDNNSKTAINIGTFENDYFGFIHTSHGLEKTFSIYPSLAPPYGKVLVVYDATQFLKSANDNLKRSNLSKEIKEHIAAIKNNITELSNPILVIGDMKKTIKFE